MSDIITVPDGSMPAMSLQQAVERQRQMTRFVQEIMQEGTDFGVIPGTDTRTLLKPGAEKLTTLFGLTKRFTSLEKIQDWTGADHGGEPFFYYLYRCHLYRGDLLIAEGDGSCNSMEKKYRYRKTDRICPYCNQATIIKGKTEYGGGWICWTKRGGCGAKFRDGDEAIEGQEVGLILNPNVADQVNTILKMAMKRALVAATLLAVNASEFFTQDLEDVEIVEKTESEQAKQQPAEAKTSESKVRGKEPRTIGELYEMAEARGITKGDTVTILQDYLEKTRGSRHVGKYLEMAPKENLARLWEALQAHIGGSQPEGPLSAEDLKAHIARLVAGYRGKSEQPSEAQLAYCRTSLGKLGVNDHERHTLTLYLFGIESTNDLSAAQASALIDWVGAKEENHYAPSEHAFAEAQAVITAYQVQQGQEELPF